MGSPAWSLTIQTTMAEALRHVAEQRREQEALVCDSARVTYGQLLDQSHALAHGLYELGVRKGDRIAVLLPPGLEFALTFFAVAELGAVIVPLNPQLRQRSIDSTLRDAEPAALVTADAVDRDLCASIAGLRHVITLQPGRGHEAGFADLIASGQAGSASLPHVEPQDLLALLYTSGTTGVPKGTMHSHRSLIAPVVASTKLRELWIRRLNLQKLGQMAKALARYRERLLRAAGRPQTMLSTTGWHTITGLGLMLQALLMGDRLVVMARFHPRQALQMVQQERVTVLVAVPTAFQVMLGVDGFEQYDLSSLLICGTGSAPCPPHLAQEIQRRFGCALHIGFGATETAGGIAATSLADSDQRQAETVGRPMPGMEIKIVDEQRRELPPGQVGELACRSDSVMLGYYRAPEATAEVIDEQGWYYTGDLAQMDEKGYVRIVGRIKDVIIRGGQNIYPAEIETYLASHPKVREAAVVGVPSDVGGETVCAFILLEDGVQMTEPEVLDYCRAGLELFKIPGQVRFVSEFPRAEGGKPRKQELRQVALQQMNGVRDERGG